MNDVTQILDQIEKGAPGASDRLLPLVYAELHRLAGAKLHGDPAGQTLQATALVHEAYIRLVDSGRAQSWNGRGHFFRAAAEAMRRILVERARRKQSLKHGGKLEQVELREPAQPSAPDPLTILTVNDALEKLETVDDDAAAVVKLHFFSGFTLDETAEALSISRATVYRHWSHARAWLRLALRDAEES